VSAYSAEKRKKLGEILKSSGLISEHQLQEALESQKGEGGMIGEVLVKLGFVGEIDIVQALTTQYGFPYMPVENYELNHEMTKTIPENVAQQYALVPIDVMGDILTVAMSNPLNDRAIEELEKLTQKKVQVFISTVSGIAGAIKKLYKKQ
jgi:type IV pilus assembly protein PilB